MTALLLAPAVLIVLWCLAKGMRDEIERRKFPRGWMRCALCPVHFAPDGIEAHYRSSHPEVFAR